MSEHLGENLNRYQFSQLIDGASAKELHEKLRSIRIDFSIAFIWAAGASHYALINLNRNIKGDINDLINTKRKQSSKKSE